jgi:hypothetical protein
MTQRTGFIGRLWEGWKRFGRKLGDFQARLLLTMFYFVIAAPFAIRVKISSDPLSLAPRTPKGWRPRVASPGSMLERARRQF